MKYELAHDILARQVFEKSSVEAKARRKADAFLDRAYARYEERGVLLTEDDLEELRPFLKVLNISEEEGRFIRKSRRVLRRKRRRSWIIALSTIAILSIALIVAGIFYYRLNSSQKKLKESNAQNQYNSTLFGTTVQYELEGNATKSLQTALKHPNELEEYFQRPKFREVFFDAYLQGRGGGVDGYYNPFFRRIEKTGTPILALQYDQQGLLQTAHQDGTLVQWDANGYAVDTVQVAQGLFSTAQFADTKDRLAFFTMGGRIELVFLTTNQKQALETAYGRIRAIQFDPARGLQATATDQNAIEMWDTLGQYLGLFKKSSTQIIDFQFAQNGLQLFTHTRGTLKDSIRLYDLSNLDKIGTPKKGIADARGAIKAATLSPSDGTLVTANAQGTIVLRRKGRLVQNSADDPIQSLQFLNQGKHLLVHTRQELQLFDYNAILDNKSRAQALTGTIPLSGIAVTDIVPLADHLFAIKSASNTIKVFYLTGEEFLETVGPESNVRLMATHPGGPLLSTVQVSGNLYNWFLPQVAALHPEFKLPFTPEGTLSLQFDSVAAPVVLVYGATQLALFDYERQAIVDTKATPTPIAGVVPGESPRSIIVIYKNGQIEQWAISLEGIGSSVSLGTVGGPVGTVMSHPYSRWSAIRTQRGELWVLQPENNRIRPVLLPTAYRFDTCISAPQGRAVAGITTDRKFVVLYGKNWQELPDLLEDISVASITSMQFTRQGRQLWLGTEDGAIFQINLSSQTIQELTDSPFNSSITHLEFLANRMLVATSETGQVRFLKGTQPDTIQLETITPEGENRSPLKALVPVENRNAVIGFSPSGGVKVWRSDGQLDMSFQLLHPSPLKTLVALPRLRHILTFQENGLVKTWHLHPGTIVDQLKLLQIIDVQ